MTQVQKIAVLGGGAWGTALAASCARAGHETTLYARDDETVSALMTKRRNPRYLGEIELPVGILATSNMGEALKGADVALIVIPAQAIGLALGEIMPLMPAGIPLVLCAKGIERGSGRLMTEVVAPMSAGHDVAVLSGPSFATDVARGLPTAVTVACENSTTAKTLAHILSGQTLRCYSSQDVVGVELGGAIKNVLAVAAGASTGAGYGASAQAALITRGFAELRRLGKALGAKPETIMGLSGLGDLMLTCSSTQSRNYSYGIALGRGDDLANRPLAEGVATAPMAAELCRQRGVKAPIIETTAALLSGALTLKDAVDALLQRPLKQED